MLDDIDEQLSSRIHAVTEKKMRRNTGLLCLFVFLAFILFSAEEAHAGGPLEYGLGGLFYGLGITGPGAAPFNPPPAIERPCSERKELGPIDVPAILGNRSPFAVNLVADAAPIDSSSLLAPGETRSVTLFIPYDRVTFHAVRDGIPIASQTWIRDPGASCSLPIVLFEVSEGLFTLRIVTGMKP